MWGKVAIEKTLNSLCLNCVLGAGVGVALGGVAHSAGGGAAEVEGGQRGGD